MYWSVLSVENGNNYGILRTEIDHIKEDIKEVKEEAKENNKYFREVIDTLKENSIQQTAILRNQERQFTQVNNDIEALADKLDKNAETHTKWYQDFLNNNFGTVFKVLIVLVLLLSGVKLAGFDIGKLLGM